jgi:hypothetical protein
MAEAPGLAGLPETEKEDEKEDGGNGRGNVHKRRPVEVAHNKLRNGKRQP